MIKEKTTSFSNLSKYGYLNLPVPNRKNIVDKIIELKKEKNATILAHYYQNKEIQDLADFLGDSLYLSQVASKVKSKMIVFAGVHFMAETAKIINPIKKLNNFSKFNILFVFIYSI